MRKLAQHLGVEAMSIYHHVANKEDILDGIVEVLVGEVIEAVDAIDAPATPADWKAVVRARILEAREVLLRHRWAPAVLESRTDIPPSLLGYY
jgi:AcrR family transcriptional regulator